MNIRRQRTPGIGASNFNQTQTIIKQSSSFAESLPLQLPKNRHIYSSQSIIKPKPNPPSLQKDPSSIPSLIPQIRKAYKGKINIWKMAKSWNFSSKGFITQQDLKTKMQCLLGIKISDETANQVMNQFGSKQGKMDIDNFLKVIYGNIQFSSYKPLLFNVRDYQKERQEKLNNLIDQIPASFNSSRKGKSVECLIDLNKLRESESLNKKLKIESNKPQEANQFQKQQFFRVTKSSFESLKKTSKLKDLHPEQFLSIDQSKTRFGATFTNFNPHYCSNANLSFEQKSNFLNQKHQKIEREKMRVLRVQKLEQEFKQNVNKVESKNEERMKANLVRKKLQKEAYEYTCFLKNKWL